MPVAKNLPVRPRGLRVVTSKQVAVSAKKFIPRDPRDGEVMLEVSRPQIGPYAWQTYAAGDLIGDYVVVIAKPPYTLSGEGWKRWEQLVIARVATDKDRAAVEDQRAAQDAEAKRVMDAMRDR